jgi:hypothetical protein
VTDDRPRIEYVAWVRRVEIAKTLPALLAVRTVPQVRNADETLGNEITQKRDELFLLYAAGLAAYAGNREEWARIIANSGGPDMNNPYYRWLLGGDSGSAESPFR